MSKKWQERLVFVTAILALDAVNPFPRIHCKWLRPGSGRVVWLPFASADRSSCASMKLQR
jgi:hypothetical protein